MKLNKIILFASASLLMTSCGIYNKYERPEVNTKGLVRDVVSNSDTLAVSDTASFGNLPWPGVHRPAAAVAHRERYCQQYQYAQCRTQRQDGRGSADGG